MGFNINNFRTNIADFGTMPTNTFKAVVSPPPILQNKQLDNMGTPYSIKDTADIQSFRIESVRLPGFMLINADIPRYGIGPTQKYAYSAQINEIPFVIVSDRFGYIYQFWYQWARGVFNFAGTLSDNGSSFPTYTSEYKDNYASTIEIFQYDSYGNIIQRIILYDAFPIMMQDAPLSWGDQNNIVKFTVTLSFKEYVIIGSDVQSAQG